MYNPETFITPLTLLLIPQEAIQDVQAKLQDKDLTLAQYTQDCKSLRNRKSVLEHLVIHKSTVDVGY